MKRIILFCIFFFLFSGLCYSQNKETVVLQQELEKTKNPEKKAQLLTELCQRYWELEPKQAVTYGEKAVELAGEVGNKRVLAEAYKNLGAAYDLSGQFTQSVSCAYKALALFEELQDTVGIAKVYNNIGTLYIYNAGKIGTRRQDLTKALEYLHKTLEFAEKSGDSIMIRDVLSNIGIIYGKTKLNQPEKELYYKFKVLELSKEAVDVGRALSSIGITYQAHGRYAKGLEYMHKALALLNEQVSPLDMLYLYRAMAKAYSALEKDNEALETATKSYKIAKNLNHPDEILSAYNTLRSVYLAQGNHRQAYRYLSLFRHYQDSLNNLGSEKHLAELHTRYEAQHKQVENQRLHAERSLQDQQLRQRTLQQYAAATGVLLMALLAFTFFQSQRRLKVLNLETSRQNSLMLQQGQDLEQQKREVEQLNQVKDRLFSILSHDLRGPIISLKALLQLMAQGAVSREQLQGLAQELEKQQQNTLSLLDNLLLWARTQMRGINPKPELLKLDELVREAVSLLKPQAEHKGVAVTCQVSQGLQVMADAGMVRLVLRNLLSNAIKFSRCEDSVALSAGSNGDGTLTVTVQDTGVGMNGVVLSRLFSLSTRSVPGTNRERGTGLGLVLCRQMVELNRGTIWASSTPGKGSSFSFSLPEHFTFEQVCIA